MSETPESPPGSGLPGYDTDAAKTQQERLEADPALEPALAQARDASAPDQLPAEDEAKEEAEADEAEEA